MTETAPRRTVLVISLVVGIVLAGFVAILAVGAAGGSDDDETSALLGRPAPPVVGTTLEGEAFDMDDLRGEWVLVNFFATWCPPCIEEHPELVAFDEAHADDGVEVVSVAFQNDPDDVQAFFDQNGGEWPVLGEGVDPVAVQWGVTGLPESFLVSPQGIVVHKFTGGVTEEDLESILAQARGLA